MNQLEVHIDGKYTVIQDSRGKLVAHRYGQPWRECVGDNLILAMAHKIEEYRNKFSHYFESNGTNGDQKDQCKVCKMDLRDLIHKRI